MPKIDKENGMKIVIKEVAGFAPAIEGMRHPLLSYDKADSKYCDCPYVDEICDHCKYFVTYEGFELDIDCINPTEEPVFVIGPNDLDLCKRLISAGTEHRKFLRQIQVWVEITAPLMWWKQADQYKIGTTTNSTSTMHKLGYKEFEPSDFETEGMHPAGVLALIDTVDTLNGFREAWLNEKDETEKKRYWQCMNNLLPQSYLQKRTLSLNYETILTMCKQRQHHKLGDWHKFIQVMQGLPYMSEFLQAAGVELEGCRLCAFYEVVE